MTGVTPQNKKEVNISQMIWSLATERSK